MLNFYYLRAIIFFILSIGIQESYAQNEEEKLYQIYEDRKFGLINENGKVCLPPDYYELFEVKSPDNLFKRFNDRKIKANIEMMSGFLIIKDSNFILLNADGKKLNEFEPGELIELNHTYIDSQRKVVVFMHTSDSEKEKFLNATYKVGIQDENGEVIYPAQKGSFSEVYWGVLADYESQTNNEKKEKENESVSELIKFQDNKNNYGLKNKEGDVVIHPQYQNISEIGKDLYKVQENELFGVINLKGKWIIKPIYSRIVFYEDPLFLVFKDEYQMQYINKKGKVIWEMPEDDKTVFNIKHLNQKFKNCEPGIYITNPSREVSFRYDILGLGKDGKNCLVKTQFMRNPNEEWVGKSMICDYDNSEDLLDMAKSCLKSVTNGGNNCNCKGEFVNLINE